MRKIQKYLHTLTLVVLVVLGSSAVYAQADLTFGSHISAIPNALVSTSPVSLRYTVENDGSSDVFSTYLRYYLSTDTQLSGDDQFMRQASSSSYVTATGKVTRLSAGGNQNFTKTLYFPAGATEGNYYILAVVDYNNLISESNENNNVAAVAVEILKSGSDLTVTGLNAPSQWVEGTSGAVSFTVKNIGTTAAGASSLNISLFSGSAMVANLKNVSVAGLEKGTSKYFNETVTIPSSLTAPANYTLKVTADYNNAIAELNENNNTVTQSVSVLESIAELTVTGLSAPSPWTEGQTKTVSFTVRNNGTIASGTFGVNISLFSGSTVVANLKNVSVSGLAESGNRSFNESVTIPKGLNVPATFTLKVTADYDDVVAELDENNNTASTSVEVKYQPPLPDLSVQFKVTPATGNYRIDFYEHNTGDGDAGAHRVYVYYDNFRLAGSAIISKIDAKTSYYSGTIFLNEIVPPNTLVTVVVDALGEIAESNEGNNTVDYRTFNSFSFRTAQTEPVRNEEVRAFPNPFTEQLQISYSVAKQSSVTLKVYDAQGLEVATLVNNKLKNPGRHKAVLKKSGKMRPGLYTYRLSIDGKTTIRKVILK